MSLPIRVSVSGSDFLMNQVKGSLFMRSGFSIMAYLSKWAMGMGGVWENQVDHFLERCKIQGFDGVRVFGETGGWARDRESKAPIKSEHPFFSKQASWENDYGVGIWNLPSLRNRERPHRLSILNQKIIFKLVEKLQKHALISEYVTDATLKHDGVSAGTIGHCIRQTASFFHHIENNIVDPDVFDLKVAEQFRHIFDSGEVNVFHEFHNEWDAHNQAGLDMRELTMQFIRHRRVKDGYPEQWPRGIAGVSHGGKNEIDYPVGRNKGADYVAIHPTRNGEWYTRTNLERRYKHKPRYYNESKCYLSPDEWDTWVGNAFSVESCTKNLSQYMRFMEETQRNGISFCVHDFVGMASGFFENEELPTSPLEEELGGIIPPPPPPPKWTTVYEDKDTRLQKKG